MTCTVISLCPFELNESKPGLFPTSEFIFPPAPKNGMSLLYIEDGWHMLYVDHERGSIKVPDSAEKIATAIVYDAKVSKPYGVLTGEAEPGIFWLMGKLTDKDIAGKYNASYQEALGKQLKWFENLVAEGDDAWNRFHSHRMISDTCRLASKYLGFDRPWNIQATVENMKECAACTTVIPARAVVCPQCGVILDAEKYKSFAFTGAK